jgi:glycine reductase complex component B subunit gamma
MVEPYRGRAERMKVVHYVNQFFAGLGGEEAAGSPPVRLEGAVGPGRGLGLDVAVTLACGDDFFGEQEDEALAQLLRWLDEERPDVLVCGPSFGSGRYGYACGLLGREAARRGIPAVCGMWPESPGVAAAEGAPYIVPTTQNVVGMRDALPRLAALAQRLAAGEELGAPQEEGYLPRGLRRNEHAGTSGAARAIELLLGKLAGETHTEASSSYDQVPPPPAVPDLAAATLALVTEAGCVPQGNPDRLPTIRARAWLRYPIADEDSLAAGRYESIHGGFDVSAANADPNRLVPLDIVRRLQREGRIGHIHDSFYTTTGNGTPVAASTKFGQEIAEELKEAGVEAVILSGT